MTSYCFLALTVSPSCSNAGPSECICVHVELTNLTLTLHSCWTAQQRRVWPITMRQSCRGVVRRDSRKSTTCSKCSRPKFSSCRRFVCLHLQRGWNRHTGASDLQNIADFVFPGGPASTQRGWTDGLASWITLQCLPPLLRHPHGGHPRGWEASEHPVSLQHQQRQVKGTTKSAMKQTKSTSFSYWQTVSVFRLIEALTKELRSKEALITELSGEKTALTQRVGELEGQVEELSSSLLQKDKDVEVYAHFIHALDDT